MPRSFRSRTTTWRGERLALRRIRVQGAPSIGDHRPQARLRRRRRGRDRAGRRRPEPRSRARRECRQPSRRGHRARRARIVRPPTDHPTASASTPRRTSAGTAGRSRVDHRRRTPPRSRLAPLAVAAHEGVQLSVLGIDELLGRRGSPPSRTRGPTRCSARRASHAGRRRRRGEDDLLDEPASDLRPDPLSGQRLVADEQVDARDALAALRSAPRSRDSPRPDRSRPSRTARSSSSAR